MLDKTPTLVFFQTSIVPFCRRYKFLLVLVLVAVRQRFHLTIFFRKSSQMPSIKYRELLKGLYGASAWVAFLVCFLISEGLELLKDRVFFGFQ